ncbi:MAG: hypothetical protein AAFR11_05610 [Pseudomonadota bacterium]
MAKTQADLQTKVARLVRLQMQNAALSADNAARLTEYIETAQQELEELELAYWSLTAIPEHVFDPFARYVASLAQAEFPAVVRAGQGYNPEAELMRIRRIVAVPWNGGPTREDRF